MRAEDSLQSPIRFYASKSMTCLLFALLSIWGVGSRSVANAQNKPNNVSLQILEPGVQTESEINGGESKTFGISLRTDRYVHVIVQQEGIDVDVMVYGPNGDKQSEVDRPNGIYGPEALSLITKQDGLYRLQVHSFER